MLILDIPQKFKYRKCSSPWFLEFLCYWNDVLFQRMSWMWKCIGLRRNHPGFTSHSVNCTSDFIQLLLWQVGAKDLTWKISKPFSALKALFQAVDIFYAYSYLGNTQTQSFKICKCLWDFKGCPTHIHLKTLLLDEFHDTHLQ